MNETINVKPAAGLIVRDPITHEPLPVDGATVPRNTHWLRRLRDGDVQEVQVPPAQEVQSEATNTKKSRKE